MSILKEIFHFHFVTFLVLQLDDIGKYLCFATAIV